VCMLQNVHLCGGGQEFVTLKPSMVALVALWREEEAQGLVEYVLIVALIAFAAVAGMSSLATSINSAFAKVATYIGNYVS
jgi:pilus assembly protein Flp/PilA